MKNYLYRNIILQIRRVLTREYRTPNLTAFNMISFIIKLEFLQIYTAYSKIYLNFPKYFAIFNICDVIQQKVHKFGKLVFPNAIEIGRDRKEHLKKIDKKYIFLKYAFISLILRLLQKGENKGDSSLYSYSICALLWKTRNKNVQLEFEH